MLLSWFNSLADTAKVKLEDSMSAIRCSLEFLGSRSQLVRGDPTVKEATDLAIG